MLRIYITYGHYNAFICRDGEGLLVYPRANAPPIHLSIWLSTALEGTSGNGPDSHALPGRCESGLLPNMGKALGRPVQA